MNESNAHEKDANPDEAVERWLHGEVATAYDALKQSSFRAIAAQQMRAQLLARSKKRGLGRLGVAFGVET